MDQVDAELVRKQALAGELDLAPHRLIKQVLIDPWDSVGAMFQAFLVVAGLSSHLWIAARER